MMVAETLESLLRAYPHLLWRGNQALQAPAEGALPTGFAALDALLPGGGWPRGQLTELVVPRPGIGELALLLPALRRVTQTGHRAALVNPPFIPYAPALAAAGVDCDALLVVAPVELQAGWWAAEQILAHPQGALVLVWPEEAPDTAVRRLQVTAGASGNRAVLYRSGVEQASRWAALRLRLAPTQAGLAVELDKARGRAGAARAVVNLEELTG